jgi:hypothetical protein
MNQIRIDATGEALTFGGRQVHSYSEHLGEQLYLVSFVPRAQIADLVSYPGYHTLELYELQGKEFVKQTYITSTDSVSTFSHCKKIKDILEIRPSGVLDKDYSVTSHGIKILNKQRILHFDQDKQIIQYDEDPVIDHSRYDFESGLIHLYQYQTKYIGTTTSCWYDRYSYNFGSGVLLDIKEQVAMDY